MNAIHAQDWVDIALPVWGAVLSTGLALLKVWEFQKSRLKLSTTFYFTSEPEEGNKITVINTSDTPILISYWELIWVKRVRLFQKKLTYEMTPDPDDAYYTTTIGPHSTHTWHFSEGDFFLWGPSQVSKGQLYLKLYILGRRRPRWLKVYDPAK